MFIEIKIPLDKAIRDALVIYEELKIEMDENYLYIRFEAEDATKARQIINTVLRILQTIEKIKNL